VKDSEGVKPEPALNLKTYARDEATQGLIRLNPKSNSSQLVAKQTYTSKNGVTDEWVTSLLQTSDGRFVWCYESKARRGTATQAHLVLMISSPLRRFSTSVMARPLCSYLTSSNEVDGSG